MSSKEKDMVCLLNLNDFDMDHRRGHLIVSKTWLSACHFQYFGDVDNYVNVHLFPVLLFFYKFATFKIGLTFLTIKLFLQMSKAAEINIPNVLLKYFKCSGRAW